MRVIPFSELPFRVGKSPFHMKGVAFRETLDSHRTLPGGMEAVRAALPTAELRAYYDTPFLASNWYDLFAMMHFDAAAAKVLGADLQTYLAQASHTQGRNVAKGIYKVLLKFLSSGMIARYLPQALTLYYDFGSVRAHKPETTHVEARISEIPEHATEWFLVAGAAFITAVLEITGTPSPEVTWDPPQRNGTRHGLSLSDTVLHIRWSRT